VTEPVPAVRIRDLVLFGWTVHLFKVGYRLKS
jgi:hypothetical protein